MRKRNIRILLRGLPGPVLEAGACFIRGEPDGSPSNTGLEGNCRILGEPAGLGDVGASIPVGTAAVSEGDNAIVTQRMEEVVVENFMIVMK